MRIVFVSILLLFCACASAREKAGVGEVSNQPTTEIGTLAGADYRIDMPSNWNRGLVVFFHGYVVEPVRYTKDEAIWPMLDPVLKAGFAVVQSGYSQTGWAVEQGSADSERLRKYFVAKHGLPKETYAMGMSMGGTLTVMAIESAPAVYAGALSLCGVIEPTGRIMQRDFALRAAFDYYFPDVLGPLVPVAADFTMSAEVTARITAAMKANPRAAAAIRAIYGTGDSDSLPYVLAFITFDIGEMQRRTHGNPFDNSDLVYTGPDDAYALNDGVHRFRADPRAASYLWRWYTPTGKLLKPLLALHDTGDPLVVASTAFEYALLAQRAGHGEHFVQQYVNAEGHCVFTPAQIGTAFGELVDWSRTGKRPAPGRQRR